MFRENSSLLVLMKSPSPFSAIDEVSAFMEMAAIEM